VFARVFTLRPVRVWFPPIFAIHAVQLM